MCDVGGKDGGGRENEDSWQRWLRGDMERMGSRAPADSWSLGGGDRSSEVSGEEKGMVSCVGG